MENFTSAISVLVDTHDKEMANDILKNLGLNMSTFVNMAIKQLLYTNGLPFEVKNPIKESNIIKEIKESTISDAIKEKTIDNYNNINTMPNFSDYIK